MDIFVTMHSWVRWLVFLGLVASVGIGISRHLKGDAAWEPGYYRASVMAIDFQLLLGIILYLGNEGWDQGTFIAVIHPVLMLLAIAVAHIGLRYASAHVDESPDRVIGYSFFITTVLVIVAIPWQRLGG